MLNAILWMLHRRKIWPTVPPRAMAKVSVLGRASIRPPIHSDPRYVLYLKTTSVSEPVTDGRKSRMFNESETWATCST